MGKSPALTLQNYLCCDKAKNIGSPIAVVEFLFEDLSERQRLKELTANTHHQMTPPPCQTFKHSTKFATPQPGGGVLQRANFHNTLCFRLFLLF